MISKMEWAQPSSTVRAKNNGRALTHTVRAFQLADAVVAVFLLFFAMRRFPLNCAVLPEFWHINLLNHKWWWVVKLDS